MTAISKDLKVNMEQARISGILILLLASVVFLKAENEQEFFKHKAQIFSRFEHLSRKLEYASRINQPGLNTWFHGDTTQPPFKPTYIPTAKGASNDNPGIIASRLEVFPTWPPDATTTLSPLPPTFKPIKAGASDGPQRLSSSEELRSARSGQLQSVLGIKWVTLPSPTGESIIPNPPFIPIIKPDPTKPGPKRKPQKSYMSLDSHRPSESKEEMKAPSGLKHTTRGDLGIWSSWPTGSPTIPRPTIMPNVKEASNDKLSSKAQGLEVLPTDPIKPTWPTVKPKPTFPTYEPFPAAYHLFGAK